MVEGKSIYKRSNLWVSLDVDANGDEPRPTIRALAPKEWAGMLDENLALTTPEFP